MNALEAELKDVYDVKMQSIAESKDSGKQATDTAAQLLTSLRLIMEIEEDAKFG